MSTFDAPSHPVSKKPAQPAVTAMVIGAVDHILADAADVLEGQIPTVEQLRRLRRGERRWRARCLGPLALLPRHLTGHRPPPRTLAEVEREYLAATDPTIATMLEGSLEILCDDQTRPERAQLLRIAYADPAVGRS